LTRYKTEQPRSRNACERSKNHNNSSKNLDVFSTNFFGYAGYVGEGPCGAQCNVSNLAAQADLIDKLAYARAIDVAALSKL
jgi:hypothetical protein